MQRAPTSGRLLPDEALERGSGASLAGAQSECVSRRGATGSGDDHQP
jgi:hypothetical protein